MFKQGFCVKHVTRWVFCLAYWMFILSYALYRGCRGLMIESRTHNRKVASSIIGPSGIVGGGSECTAFSPPSIQRRGILEQGTGTQSLLPGRRSIKWLPTSRCVCVHWCVCALGWINAEHKFRVWVTILGCMSLSLICKHPSSELFYEPFEVWKIWWN